MHCGWEFQTKKTKKKDTDLNVKKAKAIQGSRYGRKKNKEYTGVKGKITIWKQSVLYISVPQIQMPK